MKILFPSLIFCALLTVPLISIGYGATDEASIAQTPAFPDIRIGGYKRYFYDHVNMSGGTNESLLPADVSRNGTWQESLKLSIKGDISEKLWVYYDLEQIPGRADIFNASINYDNYYIDFGMLSDVYASENFLPHDLSGVILSARFGPLPLESPSVSPAVIGGHRAKTTWAESAVPCDRTS